MTKFKKMMSVTLAGCMAASALMMSAGATRRDGKADDTELSSKAMIVSSVPQSDEEILAEYNEYQKNGAFSLDEDGIIPLGMFEQNEGILKYAVYSRMYQEEPQYNDVFDYDVSAIKNICYSANKRKKTGTYEQGLSYSDFCQKIFTDKHLMEKILSDKEKEMYKKFIKEESGY